MSRRPRRQSPRPATPPAEGAERLQKVLAAAGIGSRRECEELIVTGRVEVDGQTITALGTRVDPLSQEIRVDGVALPRPKRVYFALNKPPGVVCTNRDPSGRLLAVDLVRSDERLFTVGRLDRTSEGLILVTNDGALANKLTHPRYEVEKRYLVRVVGSPSPEILTKLRQGVRLAEGVARVSDIRVRSRSPKFTEMEIELREGRNREIRRLLARVGHKVVRLKRIAIGSLRLGELPVGESRPLTRDEIRLLQSPPQQKSKKPPSKAGRRPDRGTRRPQSAAGGKSARPPASTPAGRPARPAKPPAFEPDEVEVTEWNQSRPTGAVLSFDDSPAPPAFPKKTKKHRRP